MNKAMDLQNTKIELIQWLSTIDDVSILNKVLEIKKKENTDWWQSISTEEKGAIEKGITDADAGKLTPHSKAREIYEKWL